MYISDNTGAYFTCRGTKILPSIISDSKNVKTKDAYHMVHTENDICY